MALLPFFGSIVSVVLSQLWNPLVLHLGYPVKVEGNVKKLTIFTKRLQARRDDIKAQIDIAERRHKTCKHEAKEWLQRVEAIEGEVEAVKHAYDERCRCCGEFSLDIIGKHRISRRAAKKLKRVMELFDQGGAFEEIAVELPPPPIEEMPIASAVIGMQSNLEKILRHLKDDEVGAVGVWGMGGVGKTTLLKTINNHLLADFESFRYDHVVCIAASKGCKLENLQLDIAEKIGLYLKQDSSITTSHTSAIFNFLKNKKFLLLLDDLWEPIDLAGVGIPQPNGARNQKIVLTTRFEEVFGNMGVHTKIKLECLEPDNAWELFKNSVSEDTVNSDARIQSLARKVCRRCSGLPLALISVGRSMSTKRTLQEWENAIASLENTRLSEIHV
uniref:NB-ARC domain-containing protein n=1 Tax=Ananas comosus var. bracteatus TaxID=296719 RepID=A0A6V7Q8S5_ANACO|nr:unnamed protein product [Ananas comosus var. bracteatus]